MRKYRIQYCNGILYGGMLVKEEYKCFASENEARVYAEKHMPEKSNVYYVVVVEDWRN